MNTLRFSSAKVITTFYEYLKVYAIYKLQASLLRDSELLYLTLSILELQEPFLRLLKQKIQVRNGRYPTSIFTIICIAYKFSTSCQNLHRVDPSSIPFVGIIEWKRKGKILQNLTYSMRAHCYVICRTPRSCVVSGTSGGLTMCVSGSR